jgi:two-component system sensor histidine kinase HydH
LPSYIDAHGLGSHSKEEIVSTLKLPTDSFGVSTLAIYVNKEENKVFCICQGPSKEAIENHHSTFQLNCDFITEVNGTSVDQVKADKLKAIGELSFRIAHDFRNPLNNIQMTIDKMKSKSTDSFDNENIKTIERAISRMTLQINDVLEYSKTSPLCLRAASMSTIIETALDRIEMPKTISVKYQNNGSQIKCDPIKFETLMVNLLTNSIESIGSDKVGSIKIEEKEEGNDCIISVEDSGPGISQEDLSKIFEPLFTTKQTGTGLGLSSCKTIVEQHAGTIAIKTNPTTFEIRIPKIFS